MKTLFSVILWIYWTVCIITFFILVSILYVLTFPFDRFNKVPNRILKGLAWVMLRVNPGWCVNVKGTDPQKIDQPTIVVANHQSFLDLPLLYLLPWRMKWLAKKGLFRIPILGWIIFMTGQISIDRRGLRSAQKLDRMVSPIRAGIPGMIFPEGHRSRTGELLPFKSGAFRLAHKYNFKILPIVLKGGYQAMPAGSWRASPKQAFEISVLDPIDSSHFSSVNELKNHTFALMEKKIAHTEDKLTID